MNRDKEILTQYKPVIMLDKNEPFEIAAAGCTIFRESGSSPSFPKRRILVNKETLDYAIEYALWYDYDIQHLYELEHVWVYVNHDGSVQKVEASFHGKYLNMVDLKTGLPVLREATHPVVYAQPGKHALVPDPSVIRLIPDWWESCMERAGGDGVLVQDMFADQIRTDEELQSMAETYIKERFGFRPSMEFEPFRLEDDRLLNWKELAETIPDRVNRQIHGIREYFKGKGK
ncbi:hypothetical protein AALB39_08535 [Lachnospiraceae bacterium 54-53]